MVETDIGSDGIPELSMKGSAALGYLQGDHSFLPLIFLQGSFRILFHELTMTIQNSIFVASW